jgi:AraC-like DNA-binding protein
MTGDPVRAWRPAVPGVREVLHVGAAVGFHDQSHLTRHFRRHVGTTPGRFARSGSGA